jgi:hypothetical protein
MKGKLNSVGTGVLSGILVPVIAIILVFLFTSKSLSVKEYIDFLVLRNIYTHIISLCVIPNLLTFFIFIWMDYLYSARGVLVATFGFAFIILGLKIFT